VKFGTWMVNNINDDDDNDDDEDNNNNNHVVCLTNKFTAYSKASSPHSAI